MAGATDQVIKFKIQKICVIGAGHVGTSTAAVMAYNNPHVSVSVVDNDASRIKAWNSKNLPIFEPGLEELLSRVRRDVSRLEQLPSSILDGESILDARPQEDLYSNGDFDNCTISGNHVPNLVFSTDISTHIRDADAVFICVNTPAKVGGMFDMDLSNHDATLAAILEASSTPKIIIEKSTVPCGTSERIVELIKRSGRDQIPLAVLSNPEYLAQGTTIRDLMNPDRVIIGSPSSDPISLAASDALADLYSAWVPYDRIITMSLFSSELAKLAHNAFLAQRISSINSLTAICEVKDANITDVSRAVGMNKRIGPNYLQAGFGFGGSCLVKDTASLVYLAGSLGFHEVAEYWKQVLLFNEYQKTRFVERIISQCSDEPSVSDRVAVLGFAYKRDTRDARGSPARDVILQLLERGITVLVFDPYLSPGQIRSELGAPEFPPSDDSPFSRLHICKSVYEACEGASITALLNNAKEFDSQESRVDAMTSSDNPMSPPMSPKLEGVNWERIAQRMKAPKCFFDGRGTANREELDKCGFLVVQVGVGF